MNFISNYQLNNPNNIFYKANNNDDEMSKLELFEDDIYDCFCYDIEKILDGKASVEEKEEIINSLWLIFQQKEKKIFEDYLMTRNRYIQFYCINLCILPSLQPPSLLPPPPIYLYQPSINPMLNYYLPQQPNYDTNHNHDHHIKKKKDKKEKKRDKKEKIHKKSEKSKKKSKSHQTELEFDQQDQKFNGIMRYLTRQTGGNIHDNGTIEITSNSINDSICHPKNLVNYENDSRYQSLMGSDGNAYICFDFKDMKIQLDSYTIQSNSCIGQDWYDLRNSNDIGFDFHINVLENILNIILFYMARRSKCF